MWQQIEGHDEVVELFRRRVAANRLACTYLFVGPGGIGKQTFARKLARALLCAEPEGGFDPCGHCESCTLAAAGTHPDLLFVSKPAEKSFLPLELFIGSREKRMREGLCHDLGLKPFLGGRRVAIIDDADFLNLEGANSLLKMLEEPPPHSVMILIGTSAANQLPTIRSRCQLVRFRPLSTAQVAGLLLSTGHAKSREDALEQATLGEGSVRRAMEVGSEAVRQFRRELLQGLAAGIPDSARLSSQVSAIVEQAGREAPLRRKCLRQIIGFAVEFYRGLMRLQSGAPAMLDADLQAAVERAADTFSGGEETATACLTRSLEALEQIKRNANQSTLIECWLDDLERISCGQSLSVA